jgi:muramoyltetrapeptide carboxypeptidase
MAPFIRPPSLKPGDAVGIVSPAGRVSETDIAAALDIIRSWNLQPLLARHAFCHHQSFAGTDEQRAADFQDMLNNSRVRAILCTRGGYGSVRLIQQLSFNAFRAKPKWIVGYSDITVFHAYVHQCLGIESLHGPMLRHTAPQKPHQASFQTLHSALFGHPLVYTLEAHPFNRTGKASGPLTGGNLSVLHSLAGSPFEPDLEGKILFLEDVGEYPYHIDRMCMNLVLRNRLRNLNALIVGDMSHMKKSSSGFSSSALQVIYDAVDRYNFPVIFGFPAGHGTRNLSLIMGRRINVEVSDTQAKLVFDT